MCFYSMHQINIYKKSVGSYYFHLSDFEPLPFSYGIFTYVHGNNLGNLNVVWRVPELIPDRNPCKDIEIINNIKSSLPILRSMYRFLTGQTFAPENKAEELVDARVTEFLLASDDPELAWDLRKDNGKVKDPRYEPFWKELKSYLDEKSVVHERRHTETTYMPFAISVADLRQQILDRMEPNSPAPCVSWMRLKFAPANPYKESAVRYTGDFDVKHRVQQRLLRAEHPDAHYGYTLYRLLKHFALKWKEHTVMQCLDDKAVIPVGEPGKPTASCQRKHGGSLVTGTNNELLTLDHDYNLCGIVPSVCLLVSIPDDVRGTFHQGDVHVTLKEKVLQPSSPLRHSTETVKIIRTECSDDDVNCNKPILIRYTDGGPDHRTTYSSVQMSTIGEFIALDLDMLVACRTAPNQSYNNPAERVMSLLNLGLQNVSLSRTEMQPGYEMQMKSLNSLKAFRGRAQDNLKEALTLSMNTPLTAVKNIFRRLQRGNGKVHVHDACEQDEMHVIRDAVHLIHPDIDPGKAKDAACPDMKIFYERHCRQRHYSFQVKKCDLEIVDDCPYCKLQPPRLPRDLYTQLKFLPDPVLNTDNRYKEFDEIYGTPTTDNDMPSKRQHPTSDHDKEFKSLLVTGKVRAFVSCHECGKRRVIYSAAKLTQAQETSVTRVQEELFYSCGSTLFPGGKYKDSIIVREGLNCQSPIETQYYAGVVQSFDEICFFCGDTEVTLSDEILDLRDHYSIVRPICDTCVNKGYKPSTRNSRKTKQKK